VGLHTAGYASHISEILMNWNWIFPEVLPPEVGLPLLVMSTISSMITASLGVGGGILLITSLSLTLSPAVIIPVHGSIQLGSNLGRSLMIWRHIHWKTILWFLPGVLIGTVLGGFFLVQLPEQIWQLSIAIFVLYLCWGPSLPAKAIGNGGVVLLSITTSFLTLFVGAHGPLVAAFIKQKLHDRFKTVSTIAAALSIQHTAKVIVFVASGFAFVDWVPFIIIMILFGAIGTWIGLHVLKGIKSKHFDRIFKILLSLLAIRLLWLAGRNFLQ
jgi:uncharacterized membrane protein YfcA